MRAKKVNESVYNDPTEGRTSDPSAVDYADDGMGSIIYHFEDDGMTGKAVIDQYDIMKYFGLEDDEEAELEDDMLAAFASEIDHSDIEWDEDEGPNPDEMRDFRYDR